MNNHIAVISWDIRFQQQAYSLLNKYKETSLLMLSNLKTYGTKLTNDTYSGNFKCLVANKKVMGVFVLTKIGNLLVQTDRADDYSKIIVDECLKDTIPLNGVVGDWQITKPLWEYAKKRLPDFKETLNKQEILLQLNLDDFIGNKSHSNIAWHLVATDYLEWNRLNKAFLAEGGFNQEEPESANYRRFINECACLNHYGAFIDNHLVSIACLRLALTTWDKLAVFILLQK